MGESTIVMAGLRSHHPQAARLAGQEEDKLLLGNVLVHGAVRQDPRHAVVPHPVALVVVGPACAGYPARNTGIPTH